jgi:transcription initiation factor IIE alpha subunit
MGEEDEHRERLRRAFEEMLPQKEPRKKKEEGLTELQEKVLKLMDKKVHFSDDMAKKLKIRENDIRRTLNELHMLGLVSYRKTTKNERLAYEWKKK